MVPAGLQSVDAVFSSTVSRALALLVRDKRLKDNRSPGDPATTGVSYCSLKGAVGMLCATGTCENEKKKKSA
jgi:hypothetical protein